MSKHKVSEPHGFDADILQSVETMTGGTKRKLKYVPGARFGKLLVLAGPIKVFHKTSRSQMYKYAIRCDCGVEKTVAMRSFQTKVPSCGCIAREARQTLGERMRALRPVMNAKHKRERDAIRSKLVDETVTRLVTMAPKLALERALEYLPPYLLRRLHQEIREDNDMNLGTKKP